MIRRVKKATPKDQLLRIQAAALAMVASANEGQSAERKVTNRSITRVVNRSFSNTKELPFSIRQYRALRDVSDFIAMSQRGKSNLVDALNTDLLPVCNPVSTRKHAMSASAYVHERARWIVADPIIEDHATKAVVASLLMSDPGSPEQTYASHYITSLPHNGLYISALIAAYGGGNSRAARSARARAQRRDRKGRFAWMGGGISALVRTPGGVVKRLTGRFVAQGVGNDKTFDIEAPNGKLYRVPTGSSEAIRAVIPSSASSDGFSPVPAKNYSDSQVINQSDLKEIESPQGYRVDKTYNGPGTKYTDDAYDVIKFAPGDGGASEVGASDFIENPDPDKPIFAVYRRDEPDAILGASQSWADSQATIRADEPELDKKEGRKSDPIASLTDEEFDSLADDPDFDPDKFIEEQLGAPEQAEESETPYAAVADLDDFEYKVPNGAFDIDVSSDYEPEGRTNQESEDYTDDPKILADYTESELSDALSQALLGDDSNNPEGSGFGELEFSEGLENVPAHALYEALYEAGVDPDMEVARIYDRALGTTENEDALNAARGGLVEETEEVADLDEVDEPEAVLPPAIEGASEDERNNYLESGDWTPFLQDNEEFDETGSYNLLDTDPYVPLTDEQRSEAELPDAVFDNPVDLANAISEEDLTDYLRKSVEPDSEMPGTATVSFEDEDGEVVEAYIPGEALRDALQLQGVNTNDILRDIYAEPFEGKGDQEPDDDEATEVIESLEQDGEAVEEVAEETGSGYYSVDPEGTLDKNMQYSDDYLGYLFGTDPKELTVAELSDLKNVIDQVSPKNKFLVADLDKTTTEEIFRRANLEDPNDGVLKSGYDGYMFVGEEDFGKEDQQEEAPEPAEEADLDETVKTEEEIFEDEFGLNIDMSNWEKVGGQAGSNAGAFFVDPDTGIKYYVKQPVSEKHAKNEVLASALYNELGIRHGRVYAVKDPDGKTVLVSPIIDGDIENIGDKWKTDEGILQSAKRGFVADAWLNNWDAVGAEFDNMLIKNGEVYRIDPGGSLLYRAQGQDKADKFTPDVPQIDDLRNPSKNSKSGSVFENMTDEEVAEDAKRLLEMSPERIQELVDAAFYDDPDTAQFVASRLIDRRQSIIDRFNLEDDESGVADELPGESSEGSEESAEAVDDITPFTPDEPDNPAVDETTGDYSPEMKDLFDLFANNPEAAKDFLEKVKQGDSEVNTELVDSLLEKIDKPEPESKEKPEAISEDISSEIVDSSVDALDSNFDLSDWISEDAEPFFDFSPDDSDVTLDDLLDDDTLGSADKVIKKILETYEVINNGDGTFTVNSATRVGSGGKEEKLEVKIQKNKDNTFSVLFVQTKWNDNGDPVESVVDKYAPRHSFKALSNNIDRAQKWFTFFESNDQMSTDKFMKLASKNTYKKISGEGAIEAVKATHISADGIREVAPGDRVYNWKNGKWGTVDSYYKEYSGQGKYKVKELSDTGEETYQYTDYVKVRWDNNPGKALPVVSNSLFVIDNETGYAVDNPIPVLYNSKGKPKAKQPKKPELPDPKNESAASTPPPEPEVKEAPTPKVVDIPETSPVDDIDDIEDFPETSDAEAQDIIDELDAKVGKFYNYKGNDVEIIKIDKDGVSYKNVDTGEEATTPLIYWNQEELDGVVDAPKMFIPSNPDNPAIGDAYVYNVSDGTTTDMSLTGVDNGMISYTYVDKNGKSKTKQLSETKFKELVESEKIVPGKANQFSAAIAREIREVAEASGEAPTSSGPVPEAAPQVGKAVSEFNLDGSSPLDDFASVEDAVALAKERKKSGYQHKITYDGDAVADMEVAIGVAKVDGKENTTARFRLQGSVARQLEESITIGETDGVSWTKTSGVIIPSRRRLKTGLKIDTTKDIGVYALKNSGSTFTAELEDGTKIRFYRDTNGNGFVFGNTVEVYSPNKNFSKEDLDDILQKLGVSPEKTTYPTQESLRTLSEKRVLSYFKTAKHDKGVYKQDIDEKEKDLQEIKDRWGVTPDDIIIEQGPDGRLQLSLPNEVAQKILDFADIETLYATTQGKNIDVVLGGANPGMQSSSQRVFYGLFKTGGKTSAWSQDTDMQTGGSDFVYLRPLKPGGNYNNNSTRIFVDPIEVVKRLDIFAYESDSYGAKNPDNYNYKNWLGTYGTSGDGQPEMLKRAADAQGGSPEIMVRNNVPLYAIYGYLFNNNMSRTEAIERLKALGITQVNGIPVEEFLKLYGPGLNKLTPENKGN